MKIWTSVCIVALSMTFAAQADDAPDEATLCVACHGQKGVSRLSEWPSLAGQKKDYLVIQIKAFRDGERLSPEMAPFVDNLSDQDVTNLAAYFAVQTPQAAANGDAALVAAGENLAAYCTACHGMNGQPVAQSWPNLAGQQAVYLYKQLQAYKNNTRLHPFMQAAIDPFGDAEFEALAAYYSQLDPGSM